MSFFWRFILSDVKWIKITTDIFDDEKISLIEKMPEGDTMLILWLKLLTLAGKKNDHGNVYFTQAIPYTIEMLADVFRRDARLVSLALNTFISFEMISIDDDIISILNWEKHQNVEGMDKIREQAKIRQRNYRHRKQLTNSNVTVTSHNAPEEEREIEKEEREGARKAKYGEYKNVLLTTSEHKQLIADYGTEKALKMIDNLDSYIERKGTTYKNHNLTIRKWEEEDRKEAEPQKQEKTVVWVKCPDCGYEAVSMKVDERCPGCGEYGTAFIRMQGTSYPKGIDNL